MWKSTEIMAHAIMDGVLLHPANVEARLMNVKNSHITELATETLDTAVLAVGSPTLNKTLMPSMAGALTYLKGLKPRNRVGFVFGSYGWGGQAVKEIQKILESLSWDLPFDSVNINYIPDEDELNNLKNIGNKLGEYIKK